MTSPFKQGVHIVITICTAIIALEVILRLGAFLWSGYNQYYLYYGFHELVGRGGIYQTRGKTGGYYKFPPRQILQGLRGQSSETASINSLGFRGPEFQPIKPRDTFRVICMGESSTFGFHNSDEGTYPFLLEKLLRQHQKKVKIEVINAGFPYYNTGNILSLLEEELLSYKPDVLTLYTAANDSGWPLSVSTLGRMSFWLQQRAITFFLVDQLVKKVQATKMFRRVVKAVPQNISFVKFENYTIQVLMRYRTNVKAIVALAKSNNIPIVLIKQPMTTENKQYAQLSYEKEYNSVMDEFRNHNSLLIKEIMLLRHHYLIEELENIAREENLPLVDNIAIVDQDRRRLVSWVHLTEEGNLRLAEALAAVIEPYITWQYVATESGKWSDGSLFGSNDLTSGFDSQRVGNANEK